MKSKQIAILDFLGQNNTIFTIPVFQRVYSWTDNQCEELWEDIVQAGKMLAPHFSGVLLYSDEGLNEYNQNVLRIIDGQQRLTTLNLILFALSESMEGADLEKKDSLFQTYLLDDSGKNTKLQLTYLDKETLNALFTHTPFPEDISQRLLDNLNLFRSKLKNPIFDIKEFMEGLKRLEVISLGMTNEEGPQFVFESLNAKGVHLTLADLVRNLVVTESDDQEALYYSYWEPFEELSASLPARYTTSLIIASWLASKYPNIYLSSPSEAFNIFKECLKNSYDNSLFSLLSDFLIFAKQFVDNNVFRDQMVDEAKRWLDGKPKDSISELKVFGD